MTPCESFRRFFVVVAILILLSACKSVQYVPVESTRTEIEYRDRLRTDSVFVSDSVYIREKGDTVLIEHLRYAYRDRFVRDTAYIAVNDTIKIPYPVETPLTKWQKFKLDLGGMAFGISLLAVVLGIIAFIRWLHSRRT